METRTHEKIRVESAITLSVLKELELKVKANEHAELRISGYVDEGVAFGKLEEPVEGSKITLLEIDDQGQRLPIFTGILKEAEIYEESGLYTVQIKALSARKNGIMNR